jgi:hypothetical protein
MSILEKCEKIGIELRKTQEGKSVLQALSTIQESPEELTVELFKLINKYYVQMHFFAIKNSIAVFENNTDNPIIGNLVKRILSINGLAEFGEINLPLGHFVEKLSVMSFNNSVKYQLPDEISITPELVRLSNALTVECQRINLVQEIIKEYHTNPEFLEATKRFDELRGREPIIPLSKQDRRNLKLLKMEYPNSTSPNLIYSLMCILTYIKSMMYDSFYDNIFEVFEAEDVILRKEKQLDRCTFIKLLMTPNKNSFGPNTGWILKLHNKDNTTSYAQIFSKTMTFEKNECTISIKALIYQQL